MNAIYGLYASPHAADRAFRNLKRGGLPEDQIVVLSSEPLEEFEMGRKDHRTAMPWFAVLGAAIGFVSGYLLTWLTQVSWPIDTGKMPIVTNWTNLVILFELTMLGAVFGTIGALLASARLPGKLPRFYDDRISEGRILIGTTIQTNTQRAEVEAILKDAGPETIRSIPYDPGR